MKAFIFLVAFIFPWSIQAQQLLPRQSDQIIVKLKKGIFSTPLRLKNQLTGNIKLDDFIQRQGAISVRKLFTGKKSSEVTLVIKHPAGSDLEKILAAYRNSDQVEYAELDPIGQGGGTEVTPDDPFLSRQWAIKNDGSFMYSGGTARAGADIDMERAWDIEQGDSSIVVAIIDTGCKLDHPEFTGRIWINYAEIPGNGMDDDMNGFIDDRNGWDFAYEDNDPTDDYGHGTNVTGILGATGNNGTGYAGVDWNCKLMICKALNSDNIGSYSWWASAIYYAVDNGARVINMSLEGLDGSQGLTDAAAYAYQHHVTIVACMGNWNSDTPSYPAAIPHVIAVGSTNPDDTRTHPFFWDATTGSNYGSDISVVAPGNYIYGLQYLSDTNFSTYWGGTSQATPHVTGLASLLLAQDSTRTPDQLKSIIQSSAVDRIGSTAEDTPGWDQYYGYGRINCFNALSGITGIQEAGVTFNVYPNPSSGNVNIILPNVQGATITINNSQGQVILNQELVLQTTTLNIPGAGLYMLTLKQGNQRQIVKLVVAN